MKKKNSGNDKVYLTNHARERFKDRYDMDEEQAMEQAIHARNFGLQKDDFRQGCIKSYLEKHQPRNESDRLVFDNGSVFLFNEKNVLITVYPLKQKDAKRYVSKNIKYKNGIRIRKRKMYMRMREDTYNLRDIREELGCERIS